MTLPKDTPVPSWIAQLMEGHSDRDARTELIGSKLIVDMLTELCLHRINIQRDVRAPFLPDYIKEAMDVMEKRYAEPLPLEQLAATLSVSRFHLAREFKRFTGVTPNEFLCGVRITAAKERLQHSDAPVAKIAALVGYPHVSHFINMFKKREELTPLMFRKKWRG